MVESNKKAISMFFAVCILSVNAHAEVWTNSLVYPFSQERSQYYALQDSYPNHQGVDYPCVQGTNVYASISGTVIEVKNNEYTKSCVGFGNTIVIDNGYCKVRYAHLLGGSITFGLNSIVKAGQFVGKTSNTGYSTDSQMNCLPNVGYHLHYEVQCRTNFSQSYVVYNPYNGNTYAQNQNDRGVNHDRGLFVVDDDESYKLPGEVSGSFVYDNKELLCKGPVLEGNASNGWTYTCQNQATTYAQNEQIYALAHASSLTASHQFKIEIYHNYQKVYEETGPWNNVPEYWHKAYSPFTLPAWQTRDGGLYEVRYKLYIDGSWKTLGSTSFTRIPPSPYTYNGNIYTCGNPFTFESASNNWYYGGLPKSYFTFPERVWAVARIDNITADHRFRIKVYRKDVWLWIYQWQYTVPTFSPVKATGGFWEHAYAYFYIDSAYAGEWKAEIWIQQESESKPWQKLGEVVFYMSY